MDINSLKIEDLILPVFLSVIIVFLSVSIFLLLRKIKKITRFAKDAFEGRSVSAGRHELGGPFNELFTVIDENSRKFKDRRRSLDEGRNRTFAILESMAEGVVVVDSEQKIILINSMLGQVLEIEKDKAGGRYFWEVFRDPDLNDMISRCLEDRVSIRREHSILLTEAVFQIQISPVVAEERLLGAVAVFHDVTQLKELERMRVEFVANVSHELKTPLTSIMGFVETLKEGGIEDKENRLKFLNIIDEQSKKLHALIDDLLLLSRIESQKKALIKEPLDLGGVLRGLAEFFSPALTAKKIKMKIMTPREPFTILGDKNLLERAFSNLIDNAVKYSGSGGEIEVTASETPEGTVKIRFKDGGIGIPENDIPRIFERFYRVDKSRARESGGTGLGLSIVKHILERHQGRIEVQSTAQKGSIFTIILPKN